jgi:hypothetical protein
MPLFSKTLYCIFLADYLYQSGGRRNCLASQSQTSEQACLSNKTHHTRFNNQDYSLNVAKGIIL